MVSASLKSGRKGASPVLPLCLLMAAVLVALGLTAATPTAALAQTAIRISDAEGGAARRVTIGLGKSIVVDLPRDAKEVFVANPAIANAVVRSARKVFISAAGVGQTSLFFIDGAGQQMGALDVNVQRDVGPIKAAIMQAIPGAQIEVQQLNDSVMLMGSVASADEATRAVSIAAKYTGKEDGIVNSLTIRGRDQIMLKVTVAEVQRQVLKQLGINLNGSFNIGNSAIRYLTTNPFGIDGPIVSGNGGDLTNSSLGATQPAGSPNVSLQAFERSNVLRTLAEPTLTAISGESAKFLAGGEFPILSGIDCTNGVCVRSYTYKQFGVGLTFTPVVLNEGLISLKVGTEVSDIDNKNSFSDGTSTIPAFTVRRADTTVELPSGASLVMAGMIQQNTKQVINGTPGLMNIPVLGQLFRSRDYQRDSTELMIVVTPYLAKPVDRKDLTLPGDGFADASDPSTYLLGRFNKIYGTKGTPAPTSKLVGRYGFAID